MAKYRAYMGRRVMIKLDRVFWGTLSFVALAAGQAHAQSANSNDAEISALKQQLRMMEQKLDKLQKQTAANTTAAANANAKADASAKAEAKAKEEAKAATVANAA